MAKLSPYDDYNDWHQSTDTIRRWVDGISVTTQSLREELAVALAAVADDPADAFLALARAVEER